MISRAAILSTGDELVDIGRTQHERRQQYRDCDKRAHADQHPTHDAPRVSHRSGPIVK